MGPRREGMWGPGLSAIFMPQHRPKPGLGHVVPCGPTDYRTMLTAVLSSSADVVMVLELAL